jgi:predicted metalloprotease
MDLKKQILVALGLDKGEEVNMEWQAKSEDGTIFVSTADELAEGVDVSVLTEDGSTILLPVGTYKTEDGVTFRVDEEGIVAEVMETETEEVEEEVEEEEMEEVVEPENLEARIKSLEDAVASLIGEPKEELAEEVEEVEERGTTPKSIKTTEVVEFSIEDLKAENERLKTELASAPASAPLDTNKFSSERATPTAQDFKRMTKQERFLYNLHN